MNSAAGPNSDGAPLPAFPIVGIGCSAGGLDALAKFFSAIPDRTGMAFVVVQHLSPRHVSALPELLRQHTPMAVAEVVDGMPVLADRVYVIPPDQDMVLQRGRLRLIERTRTAGLHLPIDIFLRSLALEHAERSVGVVLSGMASDGAEGLGLIKRTGGLALVQLPASASAEGMPSSAIRAGVADFVATPDVLAQRLVQMLGSADDQGRPGAVNMSDALQAMAMDRICTLLRDSSGNDFSLYKSQTLLRRIERRMSVRQIVGIQHYAQVLSKERQELDLLFRELLIGVTRFFRDAEVWDHLRRDLLPPLLASRPADQPIRVWLAGCSTGEEAFTLAMLFSELQAELKTSPPFSVQMYATDLDETAVAVARKGIYPATVAADLSAERLARFFTVEPGGRVRIIRSLREMVVFANQNVTADPPFTRLDILCCRNLLIYFGTRLQNRLIPLFHYALNPGGLLVLGSAESVGNFGHLFSATTHRSRVFVRRDAAHQLERPTFSPLAPATLAATPEMPLVDRSDNLGTLTDQLIQQTWAPAAVLVNADGDILYFSGRTGKYLEPAAGRTNINLHAMAREGLREALAGTIRRAIAERPATLQLQGLRVGTGGGTQTVDVTVQAIDKPEGLRGHVIIVFRDVPARPLRRRATRLADPEADTRLKLELQQAREALRVIQEEMQTTVEELRSSNEELQSTNEELQSTNEELTTSKEELQSVNEELQTVNSELQAKVDELTWVRNDMVNLLNSTDIATVFLDSELKLRRFTPDAVKLFRLIPGDVGRLLSDLVTDLDRPGLEDDARQVLRTLVFKESVASTHDGRWFRIRVMPYRTLDNVIDGVVITFTDVTDIKLLEAELRLQRGSTTDNNT